MTGAIITLVIVPTAVVLWKRFGEPKFGQGGATFSAHR